MPIYMKYEGIEGPVTGKYAGWIQLESCQLGTHRHTSYPREGKANGSPSVSEIVGTKVQDCSSLHLFRESLNGSEGKKVTIDFVDGNTAPFMSIELENTLVSNYQISPALGDKGKRPFESFSLNATKILYSTKPTASAKKPKGSMWDIATWVP